MTTLLGTYESPIKAIAIDEDNGSIFAVALEGGIIHMHDDKTLKLGQGEEVVSMVKGRSLYISYTHPTNGLFIMSISNGEVIFHLPYIDGDENIGGHLAITGDLLLVALGDNGGGQQVPQNADTLWGKILSIIQDDDKVTIHSVGLRNPKALTKDPDTGLFYVVDDGFYHQKVEQVRKDTNYGWNIRKGEVFCFPIEDICRPNLFSVAKLQVDNEIGLSFGSGAPIGNNEFWLAMGEGRRLTTTPMKGSHWKGTKSLDHFPHKVDITVPATGNDEYRCYIISGNQVYSVGK